MRQARLILHYSGLPPPAPAPGDAARGVLTRVPERTQGGSCFRQILGDRAHENVRIHSH